MQRILLLSILGLASLLLGNVAVAASDPSHLAIGRVLFTHTSPDGSRVVARTARCTTTTNIGSLLCGSSKKGLAATEFSVSVTGHHFRVAVLDSTVADVCKATGIINPMFTSPVSLLTHGQAGLIVLCAHPSVASVHLPATAPAGPSPRGDRMNPVDGLVAFPIHNDTTLDRPLALDQAGKKLGSTLPFPCC